MGQWQGIAILMAILMILVIIPSTPPEEIENSRFVPDIPIPSHPPCPPGSDCAEVHTCSNEQTSSPLEFETNWTATGSNRMMSSPHIVELTGDGILDIVVGTGIEEEITGSIIALDGSNGTLLWEISASGEMFASAQFAHLDGDETLDVIMGGRNHQLLAVSGSDGTLIWTFNSSNDEREQWYQFYTGQFVDDQNQDGVLDWLTSNGGDPTKLSGESRCGSYGSGRQVP